MSKRLLLFAFLFLLSGLVSSVAQIIAEPPDPTDLDAVTITLNTAGTGLENYTGDVYAHTGVTIAGTGPWQYVIGEWGNNTTQPMLEYISPGLYKLTIIPDIRTFYGVQESHEITGMNFVFRSADGTQQTTDLFWEVYGAVLPDPVAVTFNVNLFYAPVFNPETDDVYISGSFAEWPTPGSSTDLLLQPVAGTPYLYAVTLMLEPGYYEYKYFRVIDNTPSWDYGEWDGEPNRSVFITEETTINNIWSYFDYLPGDANCDGIVNVLDIISAVNFVLGYSPEPFCFVNADINIDGSINVLDVVGIANIIMNRGNK